MCWEMCYFESKYLNHTPQWFPTFSLQYLQIMIDFARFKNQRNTQSATVKSDKVVRWKSWCFGEKHQCFPSKACSRIEVDALRSEFLFTAAVWSYVHPIVPLWAPEFTLKAHHLDHLQLSCCRCDWSWGRMSMQCWAKIASFGTNMSSIYPFLVPQYTETWSSWSKSNKGLLEWLRVWSISHMKKDWGRDKWQD